MNIKSSLPASGGYGIELEYMIVDRETLAVLPIADKVLPILLASTDASPVISNEMTWSHELMSHVIQLTSIDPIDELDSLMSSFPHAIKQANHKLEPFGAALLGTGMHPWMDPLSEARLWPHDDASIYQTYHRIFNCAGHAWANLQSMHLNLAFANDQEFARLHAAVRLVLPILPALAASSPIANGETTGFLDYGMEAYRTIASSIPSIAGQIIPEMAVGKADYQQLILEPMYADIAPLDPARVLQHEWLNLRGAIARFDRNTVEIRVLDTQECPNADLAIATVAVGIIKALLQEKYKSFAKQRVLETERLAAIFRDCIRNADETMISDPGYLQVLNYPGEQCRAAELWRHLIDDVVDEVKLNDATVSALETMLIHGSLARRILRATEVEPGTLRISRLEDIYLELSHCLNDNRMFIGLPQAS